MQVFQFSTDKPIPFAVLHNSGDYSGDPAALPIVTLSKADGTQVPAQGQIVPDGNGIFRLMGHHADRNVLGPVVMIISHPSGDIAPPVQYEVVATSFLQSLVSLPQNVATAVSLLQRLVTAQRA